MLPPAAMLGLRFGMSSLFLDQIMTSKNIRARIRLHAASLQYLVGKLASCPGNENRAGPGSLNRFSASNK